MYKQALKRFSVESTLIRRTARIALLQQAHTLPVQAMELMMSLLKKEVDILSLDVLHAVEV